MNRLKSIVVYFAVLVIGVAVFLNLPEASAQTSASLSIVPKKNYTIESGESIKDTLTIRNIDTENTLSLTLRVVDFTFSDDGGAPQLMLDENAPQTVWSLKPYISVPESITIEPGSTKTVNMSVSIPSNRGAGSLYSAIVYSTGAPDGGNVGLSASGVTLVFTNIPGDVDEKLTLEKFGAYKDPGTGGGDGYMSFTYEKPEMMAYTLRNEGNVTESPMGSITLTSMFGQEYVISKVNPNESLALIGQTRKFTACIKLKSEDVDFNGRRTSTTACTEPDLWPGLYTANIDLFYGQNGNNTQEVSGSAYFWYLPLWFIAIVLIIFAVVTIFIWRTIHKIRNRGRGLQTKRLSRRR